jgi:hypothetical protein
MLKFVHILFIFIIFLQACQKQEEIMTGKITGRMAIYNQSFKSMPDRSGILVSLLRDGSIVTSDTTDFKGGYLFENIPYGKYRIDLKKDKYIQAWNPPFVYHVGGYSPTYANLSVFEIPIYELGIDSIDYYSDGHELIIYLKFDGDTVITYNLYGYPFIAYAGNSPDISKDNYITKGNGILRDFWDVYNSPPRIVSVYGRMNLYTFSPAIKDAISGTVYLRIYPLANGQGYGTSTQFYPDALGKPSNVISFVLNDLIGK